MCVVIRSVVVVMTTAHFPSQKREMPFWCLCAFSLTSAIESGHPAGASGVSPIFYFIFFFVHFWVVCVCGGGVFHPIHFDFLFSETRHPMQFQSFSFSFFLLCSIWFGSLWKRRGCWWDMSSCFNIFFHLFGEPRKFHHSIVIVQRIGKKLFIRSKLSVRL